MRRVRVLVKESETVHLSLKKDSLLRLEDQIFVIKAIEKLSLRHDHILCLRWSPGASTTEHLYNVIYEIIVVCTCFLLELRMLDDIHDLLVHPTASAEASFEALR
jgi:hypothetical protein